MQKHGADLRSSAATGEERLKNLHVEATILSLATAKSLSNAEVGGRLIADWGGLRIRSPVVFPHGVLLDFRRRGDVGLRGSRLEAFTRHRFIGVDDRFAR